MANKKKSYNPFKMWGSYVGVLVGLIIGIIFFTDSNEYTFGIRHVLSQLIPIETPLGVLNAGTWLLSIGIFSFLMGWGINSLWRSYKKQNGKK